MSKEERQFGLGLILLVICLPSVVFLITVGVEDPKYCTFTNAMVLVLHLLGCGQGIMYMKDLINTRYNENGK